MIVFASLFTTILSSPTESRHDWKQTIESGSTRRSLKGENNYLHVLVSLNVHKITDYITTIRDM